MKRQCPKCKSDGLMTERRIDGDTGCLKCGFKAKTSEFDIIDAETVEMNKIAHCVGDDELYATWYKCPECNDENEMILKSSKFCPNCGRKIVWI